MPMIDPRTPEIPNHRYCAKTTEQSAITHEKYAASLQTDSIDRVLTQAADSGFQKNTDFKDRLSNRSGTARTLPATAKRAKPTAHEKKLESEHATAGATI